MLYRLSLAFGETVEVLETTLTAEQVQGYVRFYELEPWGTEADDLRFAQLGHTVAQCQSRKRLDPKDHLPPWRKPRRRLVPFDVGVVAHAEHIKRQNKRE